MSFENPVRNFALLTLALFFGGALIAQNLEPALGTAQPPPVIDPSLKAADEVAGLPRVMIIGDSISMGYTLPVRKKLEGRANVIRPLENCGATELGLARLDSWLGAGKWDVIHFNFGLHDMKYLDANGRYVTPDKGKQVAPVEIYRAQLREIALRLKKTGAHLVFATTTPVPEGARGRVVGNEAIYNKAAVEVMNELGIPVNDLCAFVRAEQKKLPPRPLSAKPETGKLAPRKGEIQLPFDVHYTPDGYDKLADLVVARVEAALFPRK